METVLLLPYHGTGHVNPCLSIADDLKRSGYTCVFAGSPYFKDYVTSHQFHYHVLKSLPFASNFERWINNVEGKTNLYLAELRDRRTDRLYYWRKDELDRLVDDVKPSIVILDAMLATDFCILYEHLYKNRVGFVLLHTMIPPLIEKQRPPTTSLLLPHQFAAAKVAVLRAKLTLWMRDAVQNVKFPGVSNRVILKRRVKKNRIPADYFTSNPSLLKVGLRNVTQLVLTPAEFDFPGLGASYEYAGFVRPLERPINETQVYYQKRDQIINRKKESRRNVVYCSFGTIAPKHVQSVYQLINNLVSICSKQYILIIALRGLEIQLTSSENLFVFHTVDQPDVLQFSDAFITHGGLNSISEAIQREVPMLVIPVHANLDTQGNAARVLFHNIGTLASLRDTLPSIAEKLQFLLGSEIIKKNLSSLKQANEKYHIKRLNAICNPSRITRY